HTALAAHADRVSPLDQRKARTRGRRHVPDLLPAQLARRAHPRVRPRWHAQGGHRRDRSAAELPHVPSARLRGGGRVRADRECDQRPVVAPRQPDRHLRETAMSLTAAAVCRPHWSESLAHPLRSFHTVRHLKPVQVVNRASRLLQRLNALPRAGGHLVLRRRGGIRPAASASGAFDGRSFCFLNRRFAWEGSDRWHPPGADDLWVYNLHYFHYLWDAPDRTARALIADWIATHTSPRSFAWHPYPISLRVREWIEWLLLHDDVDQAFRDTVVDSIGRQVEALRRQLEFHLLGNHLLENAITLCWAGLSFDGPAADAWLSQGVRLLGTELGRQVLADGSHDERSPMYQALLAEAVLRLNEVAAQSDSVHARPVFELTRGAGANLLRSLGRLAHPDGGYALLNDAALGIAPSLQSLTHRFGAAMASAPAGRTWSLPSSGYLGYQDAQGGYLVFDAGAIGPDHRPGHGHAVEQSFVRSQLI